MLRLVNHVRRRTYIAIRTFTLRVMSVIANSVLIHFMFLGNIVRAIKLEAVCLIHGIELLVPILLFAILRHRLDIPHYELIRTTVNTLWKFSLPLPLHCESFLANKAQHVCYRVRFICHEEVILWVNGSQNIDIQQLL